MNDRRPPCFPWLALLACLIMFQGSPVRAQDGPADQPVAGAATGQSAAPGTAAEGGAGGEPAGEPVGGTAGEVVSPVAPAVPTDPTGGDPSADPAAAVDQRPARTVSGGGGQKQRPLSVEEIEARIEKMRNILSATPDNGEAKILLADLLIQKAATMKGQPLADIENLFFEAADLAPDSFLVPYQWGNMLFSLKSYENAIAKFEQALVHQPDHLDSVMKLGISQMNTMKYDDALVQFEKARKMIPDDFYLLYCTGRCHFELKDFDRAVELWEEALKRAPDKQSAQAIQQLLRQAKEQEASIAGTTKDENQRFIVHYAGNSQQDIGDVTMEILEDIYDQVTSDLNYKPDIQINVIFFRTEEFYELNKAGNWVGALARGEKILVPLRQGYSDMNSVKGILGHEFTHVIVNLRTNNRCPVWINEGLAVYQEFQMTYGDPTQMRSDYQKFFNTKILNERSFIPLKQINLNPAQGAYGDHIPLGYLQSYLSMRFMIERYGWQGVDALLSGIGNGNGLDESLEAACNMSFTEFEREYVDWMKGL